MVNKYGKELFEGAFTIYVTVEHEQTLKRTADKLTLAALNAAIKDAMASLKPSMMGNAVKYQEEKEG